MRSLNAALRQLVPVLLIVAVVAGAEALGCPNC